MKKILFYLSLLLGTVSAKATVDFNGRVYLVVQDIQSEEFFLERAPIIGCMGLARGAELVQFTSEYRVPMNIGCGGSPELENINYLTCATVLGAEESSDFMSFSKLKLDISKCEAKNDPKFITMLRTAAKLNFPQSNRKKEIQLILVK